MLGALGAEKRDDATAEATNDGGKSDDLGCIDGNAGGRNTGGNDDGDGEGGAEGGGDDDHNDVAADNDEPR